MLKELVHQPDDGRVYDRDFSRLARALEPVLDAYLRRAHASGRSKLY